MERLTMFFDMIGTIAFAISGAMVGIRKRTDLFGVCALGIVTATGGGVIRDMILGINPPTSFKEPIYVMSAFVSSLAVFAFFALKLHQGHQFTRRDYRKMLLYMDSIGLGSFTVAGVRTAFFAFDHHYWFTCLFCGVVTGVGGGLLRDIFVDTLPDIFYKYIYAVASLFGAILSYLLFSYGFDKLAIWVPIVATFVLRMLASKYKWELPKVTDFDDSSESEVVFHQNV